MFALIKDKFAFLNLTSNRNRTSFPLSIFRPLKDRSTLRRRKILAVPSSGAASWWEQKDGGVAPGRTSEPAARRGGGDHEKARQDDDGHSTRVIFSTVSQSMIRCCGHSWMTLTGRASRTFWSRAGILERHCDWHTDCLLICCYWVGMSRIILKPMVVTSWSLWSCD